MSWSLISSSFTLIRSCHLVKNVLNFLPLIQLENVLMTCLVQYLQHMSSVPESKHSFCHYKMLLSLSLAS